MIPLHLCIGLAPLAIYLAFVATVNLSRRPFVLNGFRDTGALALGLSGMFIAGPLELFLPERAAFHFGPFVWLLLLALYVLSVALFILSMRPRIVVYNISDDELRALLSPIASHLDARSRWAGDSLMMPQLGVQCHLDRTPSMRNVQLVASGKEQNYLGWARLERELRQGLAVSSGNRGTQGAILLIVAGLLVAIVTASLLADRESMAQALQEMLRM